MYILYMLCCALMCTTTALLMRVRPEGAEGCREGLTYPGGEDHVSSVQWVYDGGTHSQCKSPIFLFKKV